MRQFALVCIVVFSCGISPVNAQTVDAQEPRGGELPSRWSIETPRSVSGERDQVKATILPDGSVLLPDAVHQEVALRFRFSDRAAIRFVKLEILPDPNDDEVERLAAKPIGLFDVEPVWIDGSGAQTKASFAQCVYLQDRSHADAQNCIDHLTDTGLKLPPLNRETRVHELVLGFEDNVDVGKREFLLIVDSGGSEELAVPRRLRVSFPTR